MAEYLLETTQQFLQDVIAPDVRELKVRMDALEKEIESLQKQMDMRFAAAEKNLDTRFATAEKNLDTRFAMMDKKSDAQYEALMGAIRESRAQAELTSLRVVANLSERVAILETQRGTSSH